jgi:hypothetical protein
MRINKSLITYQPSSGAGSGTVTSVALSAPTGFTVSGSPITSSGTLALAFTTGYGIPPLMTGNSGKFLTTNSTTMSWVNIAGTDVTGAALTENDDTNVTMTLGGTPSTALLRSVSMSLGWIGQLAVGRGGTGTSNLTGVVIGNNTSAMTAITGTALQIFRVNSAGSGYEFFTSTFLSNPMTTTGDIIYGGVLGSPTRLGANTTPTNMFLRSVSSGAPSWEPITSADITGAALTRTNDTNVTITLGGSPSTALLNAASITMGWTGQLAVGRGGTGASTLTGVVIGNGTSAFTAVVGTAGQFLRRNTANTAYEFRTLQGGDIAGSELTKADDTNVTISLGGTPASALLQPVSLTLGWTGQLSVSRGGTGASTLTGVLIGNGTSAVSGVAGTSGQLLRRNVANTAYEFFTASLLTGNGVADRVARWTSATNLIEGTIYDNGTNIGIGTATPTHKLEVVGVISAGNVSAPNGSIMLQDNYSTGHLGNIGTMYSGGNLMLGYCVTPSTSSATAFLSATGLTDFPRSSIVLGENVSIYTGAAQTVAVGSSVTMSEKMRLTNAGDLQMITGNIQLNTATNITWGGVYGTDIPTISGTSGSGSNGFLQFYPAGSTSGVKMALRRTGQLALPSYTSSTAFTGTSVATLAVTSAGDVITVDAQQITASGTYTPTWTGLANVDSVTSFSSQYMRVGDTVTVSGWVTINATADNTPTSLSFSLPINSDTSVVNRLNGTGVQQGGGVAACLSGYGTNFGEFEVLPSVDTSVNYSFHFTYRIV